MNGIREEVAGVGDQNDDTAFDFRESSDVGHLKQDRRRDTYQEPNDQTAKEDEEKKPAAFKQREDGQLLVRVAFFVLLSRLEKHDGDGIVQYRLAKNNGVEFRVDLVGIENGQDRDWICRRQCSAHRDGFDKVDAHSIQVQTCPDIEDEPKHHS